MKQLWKTSKYCFYFFILALGLTVNLRLRARSALKLIIWSIKSSDLLLNRFFKFKLVKFLNRQLNKNLNKNLRMSPHFQRIGSMRFFNQIFLTAFFVLLALPFLGNAAGASQTPVNPPEAEAIGSDDEDIDLVDHFRDSPDDAEGGLSGAADGGLEDPLPSPQSAAERSRGKSPNWSQASNVFQRSARRLGLQTDMGPVSPPPSQPGHRKFPGIPRWVIIAVIAATAAVIVLVFLRYYKTWSNKKIEEPSPDESEEKVDTAPLLKAGQKADILADADNIVEAMHTLLLATIDELKTQKKQAFPESYTCREIAGELSIGSMAKVLLTKIVTLVEPTWFGNSQPDLSEYKNLRLYFDDFLSVLSDRGTMGRARNS
jgi:hypothetical protein